MSDIPKSKRAWSKLEAADKALDLRKKLNRELLMSFGLSDKHFEAAIKAQTKWVKDEKLLDTGRISYPDVENAFKSWLGGNYKYMSHAQIYNMATLYFKLFQRRPKWKKGKSRLYWLMTHDSRDSHKTGTTLLARPR